MSVRWVKCCCVYSMVLSPQPDRSGVGNVGACLLAASGFEGGGGHCVTVWPYVCLYLGGLVTWGQDERLWSLIYCGGFMWLWLLHTLATLLCFHLQSFSWIKIRREKKKMLTTNLFRSDGGRRGISILTSSQGQADMWLDVWCQPQRICLHKWLRCWLYWCNSTLLSYLASPFWYHQIISNTVGIQHKTDTNLVMFMFSISIYITIQWSACK